MASTHSSTKTHILIFPFPAQGHMIPLLDLTHHLAIHGGSSLTLTILVTPRNLHFFSSLLSSHPSSIKSLILPFPPHPSIPSGVENLKDLPPSSFTSMIHALGYLESPLRDWIETQTHPPGFIISDFFLGWTRHLGIPRIAFSPSGAMTLCILNSLWTKMPKNLSKDDDVLIEFRDVPNCPKYPWWQISGVYRAYVEGDPVSEFIKSAFLDNLSSWGTVVNTFREIEGVYLDQLKRDTCHDRVWAVGPVAPAVVAGRGGRSSVPVERVETWLDGVGDRGKVVVYVCFGSQAVLSVRQTEVVAAALEKSWVHFVWAVKQRLIDGHVDEESSGAIPSGFEDRVSGRGLVVRGWAPQVSILNHRAVGAFLTHCGWNSVMEGVAAGVVLLTWAMGADQFINATLIVDQLKVGIRVCEGADCVPDSDELARVFEESVSRDRTERTRALELSKAAAEATKKGGSSVKELEGLMKHLLS